MAETRQIKTALISVFHKDGLDELLKKLNEEGVKFLSTGGTQQFIESLGYECEKVENVTSYPSILGGRVKTLHPKVFGGILGRRANEGDQAQMKEYDIPAIDLVVVDLYPFEQTVASGASDADIIEKIDIGGGSTEIAVISLGGIVSNNSIRVAGDDLTSDIQEYMSRQHNVKVSERMAERIKIHVGSALTDLGDEAPEDYVVHGPNRITALPMEVPVCYQEIAHCLDKTVAKIENAVLSALENTPPELYADIVKNGIYLSGGGALLRGLDRRLQEKINIPFHIAEDPLHSVARGAGIALKNVDKFSFLMR